MSFQMIHSTRKLLTAMDYDSKYQIYNSSKEDSKLKEII